MDRAAGIGQTRHTLVAAAIRRPPRLARMDGSEADPPPGDGPALPAFLPGPPRVKRTAVAEAGCATEEDPQSRTSTLYLSLMLLVLAFFIVLFSISAVDASKSVDVVGSVAATFVADARPVKAPHAPGGAGPVDRPRGDLERSLKTLFATELAVAEFRTTTPGQIEIEMPADVLFHRGEARLRSARSDLLDGIVSAVTRGPARRTVEVTALIGTAEAPLPISPSALALGQVAALGDGLVRRGLPPGRLALGLFPGNPERVLLAFTIAYDQDDRHDGSQEGDAPSNAAHAADDARAAL